MGRLSFGGDLGAAKVVGMRAEHHCVVFIDGKQVGHLYKGSGTYEYRGEPVGADEISWVCRVDKRDVVSALVGSLAAAADLKDGKAKADQNERCARAAGGV